MGGTCRIQMGGCHECKNELGIDEHPLPAPRYQKKLSSVTTGELE